MADSLDQNLLQYLDSALAFIAQVRCCIVCSFALPCSIAATAVLPASDLASFTSNNSDIAMFECVSPWSSVFVFALPSAAPQGVAAGEGVLVHCNAGVSRSGAMVVEWTRRTSPGCGGGVSAALAAVKARRPIVTPNSNFVRQLETLVEPKPLP